MSPQGGGGTELPIDPDQLRELRVRHWTMRTPRSCWTPIILRASCLISQTLQWRQRQQQSG
eukprot:3812048-Pyramimonas_sp.AAC.1